MDDSKVITEELENQEENFQELFEKSLEELNIEEHSIVKGKVVEIQDKGVMVNIGFKSEGFIHISEFKDKNGDISIKPGDEIDVYVYNKSDSFGKVRLSYRRALQLLEWERIKEFYEDERSINGFVVKKIKGGFEVDIKGMKAFLPYSLADIRPIRDLSTFLNRYYNFKIIKLEEKNFNIILDRKSLLEEARQRKREAIYAKMEEGNVIEGKIDYVRDDGAFINFGADVVGFLPVSKISWGRIKSAKNYLRKGDIIKCKIFEIDKNNNKIILSIKDLTPNPWEDIEEKYPVGSKVKGKVVSLQDFGAFIELKPGVEGLLHVSELSWTRRKIHPSKILQVDEIIEVMVKDINVEDRKISLSLKSILPTPWEVIQSKYSTGDKVEGKIRSITPFGLFVDIGEDENLFIPKSDISWTKKYVDLKTLYNVGDTIESIITEIDLENKKFHGSVKHLTEDPYKIFAETHKEGDIVKGTVTSVESFGVFVSITEDIEALVHISQLSTERVKDPAQLYKPGDHIEAIIKKIDLENRKIALSIKDLIIKNEEKELSNYKKSDEPLAKLGDLLSI
jgi:small subunit ribosomal protein S1